CQFALRLIDIESAYSYKKSFDGIIVPLQCRPICEAMFAGQRVLNVSQFQFRGMELRQLCAYACTRFSVSCATLFEERLCLFAKKFEIDFLGLIGVIGPIGHSTDLHEFPVSAHRAE